MSININNKEKQFAGGNWGATKWDKEHTNIKLSDTMTGNSTEDIKYRKVRKRKRIKEKFILDSERCPFCKNELAIDKKEMKRLEQEDAKSGHYSFDRFRGVRVTTCQHCRAFKVSVCPACHRTTWYKDGMYKHQRNWGCGFEGKRKV